MPPNSDLICAYVARHGATILNQDRCFRGNANPPLAPAGIKEAHNLAKLFQPIEISAIFCSDKQRAVKTAEIIAAPKNIPVRQCENLRALDVGQFSGQKRTPASEAALQVYLDSPDTQIPGGESLSDFKRRIGPCLQDAVDLYYETGVPPLIVGHSSIIHEVGSIVNKQHTSVLVEPGGVIAVYLRDGKLAAEPIFKPIKSSGSTHAETIT